MNAQKDFGAKGDDNCDTDVMLIKNHLPLIYLHFNLRGCSVTRTTGDSTRIAQELEVFEDGRQK